MALFPNGFMPAIQNNSNTLLMTGLGLLSGPTAQQQAALGAQGFMQGRQASMDAKKLNQTVQWLKTVNPQLAQAVEMGALSPADAYKEQLKAQMPQKRNLMGAGGAIYDADTGEWITPPPSAGSAELGLSPVYGIDEKDNIIVGQLSKSGGIRWDGTPNGTVTPVSPEQLATMKSRGGSYGKLVGETQFAAPNQITRANQTVAQIDQILADPNLDSAVGSVQGRMPLWIRGQGVNDVSARIDQLQGKAFLEAYTMLKGGGQITEIEGQKAEAALARLQKTQGDTAYRQALKDFRDAVAEGAAKLAREYGIDGGTQMPAGNSTIPAPANDMKTKYGLE